MATTSAGLTTFVNGDASSSGQFRGYHQFGDAKTTNGGNNSKEMAQVPRPPSGQNIDRMVSAAPARLVSQDHNQSNSSTSGLGTLELVELTSNPIIEGILGPNKDGRVRNPVPSKLKGKTDNKQGNFGVMHMGASPGKKTESHGRDAAAERDAAARKTSEATASRAKAAQSDKYVPPKKRGVEAALNDGPPPTNRGSPFAVSKDDHRQRARPLAPDETKFEQARLLTLLRSINPVTVVDQICKAVAYFGGIPGAPPPEDGIFPESANTRETGALFIGWLAEIFPDLSPRSPEAPKDIPGVGKKKGKPSKGRVSLGGDISIASEPPNSRNGYGYGPAVSAPAWGLPPSLALVNPQGPAAPIPLPEVRSTSNHPVEHSQQESEQVPLTPVKQQAEDGGNSATSTSKRRRGRPKGSRNKGKGDGQHGSENDTNSNIHIDGQDHAQTSSQPTETQDITSKSIQPTQAPTPSAFPTAKSQSTLSKPNQTLPYSDQSWQNNTSQSMLSQPSVIPIGDGLSPEERAVLEAFRHQGPEAMNVVPSPVVNTKSAPEAGQKRKRAPPKPKATAPPAAGYPPEPTSNPNPTVVSHDHTPLISTKDGMQWASVDSSTTPAPPPKRPRQRKPKPSSSIDPPSRNQTASVVSSATPPIAPSTIPDSTANSSQQSIPISRPPAEGLEAHYERFASLQQQQQQQQQNGRSNTPTQPQQHVRQHSKPSSNIPQQSTPQIQQQQMQQQKSQQSSQQQNVQRDDLKINQAPSTRPSSTTFYNQRSQPSTTTTTYNQQYTSHQPPQLYSGHQASPQMSTSSYRTSSTHTMAQASPQFSQAENTYRTSSPHATISQTSPPFTQNDSNFRTNNSHNITQPSPAFAQADNRYRAPSTHSMAQPTPSYSTSRSHSQSQQSHQGHYGGFSDSSYIDLPTLESLGHPTNSGNTSVNLNASGYGQNLGVGLGASSRSSASSNTLYGSSGLGNTYDTSGNDLLRGISRSASNGTTAYGSATSALNNTYDTSANEHDMRESLLRGLGGRR